MGQYRVTVVAVGNHGCQRDEQRANPAMPVAGCGKSTCPDCVTREYVAKLQAIGGNVTEATLHHWPGTVGEVIDNLLTKHRTGSF